MGTTWKAGVASTVVTPDRPMWLAGWAARTGPSRGTLSELYAGALALEDPRGERFVLLTADLIAVTRGLTAAVAREAGRRWGLPPDRLMVVASHTHCGPEIRPDKVPFFHIPPEYASAIGPYVDRLTAELAGVVGAALADVRPARLTARLTSAPFARNRRGADDVDHDVPVLVAADPAGGRRRAVVFGYACHNTTLPPDDGRFCGDYAGFARDDLEANGDAGVALFVPGAGADQNPDPRGTVDDARAHGRTLAGAVRRCLDGPPAGSEVIGHLGVAFEDIPLDFLPTPAPEALHADAASDDPPARTKAAYLIDRLGRGEVFPASYPCPLQVAFLGDALAIVAMGGEPVIEYARQIKSRLAAPGRVVWVAGYANDMFGYVPTARVLREGGYEGNRSVLWSALPAPFAGNSESRLVEGVDRLARRIRPG